MLPRIANALTELVSPVSGRETSVHISARIQDFKKDQAKREQPKKSEDDQNTTNIIKFPKTTTTSSPPDVLTSSMQSSATGVAQTLLQILSMFHEQRETLRRWLGSGAYSLATRNQKKGAKVKSGSILDQKVE